MVEGKFRLDRVKEKWRLPGVRPSRLPGVTTERAAEGETGREAGSVAGREAGRDNREGLSGLQPGEHLVAGARRAHGGWLVVRRMLPRFLGRLHARSSEQASTEYRACTWRRGTVTKKVLSAAEWAVDYDLARSLAAFLSPLAMVVHNLSLPSSASSTKVARAR
ncbi:hypothetical protein Dimus_002708 [Dionaea muscipula]